MAWDPRQYLAFGGERLRPALDLMAHVPLKSPRTIVDLGCGAGNVTEALKARWPEARITGVDSSPEMLARARARAPGIAWIEADVGGWRPDLPVDLLFSNATLHWIENHASVFPRLLAHVARGGVFAVPMPRNWGAPSHTSISDTVRDGPWRDRLEPLIRAQPTLAPERYYDLVAPLVRTLDIWETEYLQVLDGDNPVAEYVKGSWLRRFLDALEEPERTAFETAYRSRVAAAYPPRADGKTLFPFRRLFIVAEC